MQSHEIFKYMDKMLTFVAILGHIQFVETEPKLVLEVSCILFANLKPVSQNHQNLLERQLL